MAMKPRTVRMLAWPVFLTTSAGFLFALVVHVCVYWPALGRALFRDRPEVVLYPFFVLLPGVVAAGRLGNAARPGGREAALGPRARVVLGALIVYGLCLFLFDLPTHNRVRRVGGRPVLVEGGQPVLNLSEAEADALQRRGILVFTAFQLVLLFHVAAMSYPLTRFGEGSARAEFQVDPPTGSPAVGKHRDVVEEPGSG